jgi:hypothetical protein
MKYLQQMLAFCLLLMAFTANAQNGIVGKWKAEDKPNNHMEIYLAKDGLYYSKLVFENGKTENLGKQLIKGLQFDASTKTYTGKMMPPDRNIEFAVRLTPINEDTIKVVATKFLITKTIFFIKIK